MQHKKFFLTSNSALTVDSLKVDLVVIQNTCSKKEDSNSETTSSKLVKECSLNSKTKDVHAIKYKMSKAKGTHIEMDSVGLSCQSLVHSIVDTFTRTMLLNIDQLQKQLDKDEFQEDGSMTAFWVVNNQFQKFIDSKFTLDYDSQMSALLCGYMDSSSSLQDSLLQHLK
ncbi:hypothetical protein Tco_0085107 [Tanacetum coccineum]